LFQFVQASFLLVVPLLTGEFDWSVEDSVAYAEGKSLNVAILNNNNKINAFNFAHLVNI
jgi:hypothetical protein